MAEPRMSGPKTHPVLKAVARFATLMLYTALDVAGPLERAGRGPVLGVVTHFGGLSDGLIQVATVKRWPRIMAKDVIFKIPILGWLASFFGGIPVHQPAKDATKEERKEFAMKMFSSAHKALEEPSYVVIFPEGVTREEPSMAPVRTGAARIALGARTSGVKGLVVLPQAIHYADRATLRSRAFLNVGEPLDVDDWVERNYGDAEDQSPRNQEAVRDLTAEIEERMRLLAPDYATWREAHLMGLAAEATLRKQQSQIGAAVEYGEREQLAGEINRCEDDQRERVLDQARDYDALLQMLGLSDQGLELHSAKPGMLTRFLIGSVLKMLLALPFAIIGLLINWVPALITYLTGFLRVSDPVKATIRPAMAIVSFGVTWMLFVWGGIRLDLLDDAMWIALCAIGLPGTLIALVWLSEQFVLIGRALRAWRRSHGSEATVDSLLEARDSTIDAVKATGLV